MSVFTKNTNKSIENLKLAENCPNFKLCVEIVKLSNQEKTSRIKMILFTIFGFLGLIGTNFLVFFLTTLTQFNIAMIVFDILAIGLMLGIPIKEFIQTFFKIKNGETIIVNKVELQEILKALENIKRIEK